MRLNKKLKVFLNSSAFLKRRRFLLKTDIYAHGIKKKLQKKLLF